MFGDIAMTRYRFGSMTFGEKVHVMIGMKGRGYSQKRLATDAGLSKSTISDYVRDEYLPTIDVGLRIARALGVTLDWLADDDQELPPARPPAPVDAHAMTRTPRVVNRAKRPPSQGTG